MDKRIAVIGAGAIGGYTGGHLAHNGFDVTLIDPWPEHIETIRRDGLAIEGVTQEEIGRYLYAPDLPDPDLIIRTSGEVRLSGFLLWQSAYSEFYFCDVHWPAFRRIDFLRAIRSYQQRDRRFGA